MAAKGFSPRDKEPISLSPILIKFLQYKALYNTITTDVDDYEGDYFILDFSDEEILIYNNELSPDPQGFSGGGWFLVGEPPNNNLWAPFKMIKLIAIQSCWIFIPATLKGFDIKHFNEMIDN